MPRSRSSSDTRIARAELPTITGITGVSPLAPVSRPASIANLRNSSDRSCSVVTRHGSRRITRRPSSAAAALGGEQAVEKTKAGVVYPR